MVRSLRRSDALVFALAFVGLGWFHQGGGWNQNARFALLRSIVDDGSFFIDRQLIYEKDPDGGDTGLLRRVPIDHANFERRGTSYALAWRGQGSALLPVDPAAAGSRKLVAVDDVTSTGDLSYFDGHFHPAKAPGTSLLAVPAYALVRLLEFLTNLPADSWIALTLGAWLTSLLSVGLVTALGAVMLLRLARRFASEGAARAASLSFVFATMAFPYGTFLYEHNVTAVMLLAALYAIEVAPGPGPRRDRMAIAAGLAAGFASITTFTVAPFVAMFALLLFAKRRQRRDVACFAAGVFVPFALVCAYNVECFGTPFTTNYAYQNAMFRSEGRVLGAFALPRLDVLALLLFSPFRGLFFTSPLLLASVAALPALWRREATRSVALATAAVPVFLLLVNASYGFWDGGWTAVPRHLGPAMGLMALALAPAFDRWPSVTTALATVSLLIQLLLTAVDPQVPIGDVNTAGLEPAQVFTIDPMKRYVLPLFTRERAWPILDASIESTIARQARAALDRDVATAEIEKKSIALRDRLRAGIERGESSPLELGGVIGPVSANPVGVYESYYFRLFPAGSIEARGNSFNVGELVFPGSRWSLAPLLLVLGALGAMLARTVDEPRQESASGPEPEPAPAAPEPAQSAANPARPSRAVKRRRR